MEHLSKVFNQHFQIVRANTPRLLDAAQRLRFQVYCRETGFEDEASFHDGREEDVFDISSAHSVIYHEHSGDPAAAVRLVLPGGGSEFHFPMERYLSEEEFGRVKDMAGGDIRSLAEISRFCVSRMFKSRVREKNLGAGEGRDLLEVSRDIKCSEDKSAPPRLRSDAHYLPHITLGLIAAVFEMSAEEGITHWFALMETSLLRLLGRYGIDFVPIGKPVDHRGLRQPCYAVIDDIAEGIWQKRPEVWHFVTRNGDVWPRKNRDVVAADEALNQQLAVGL